MNRGRNRNLLVFSILFPAVTSLFLFVTRIIFESLGSFSLSLNTFVGELFHHFEEFLTVILKKFIGNSEDTLCDKR